MHPSLQNFPCAFLPLGMLANTQHARHQHQQIPVVQVHSAQLQKIMNSAPNMCAKQPSHGHLSDDRHISS